MNTDLKTICKDIRCDIMTCLLSDISTQFYYLHTVKQWARYGVEVIGSGYEEYFRQVIVHVKVVIMECAVLFRIKHLKHC